MSYVKSLLFRAGAAAVIVGSFGLATTTVAGATSVPTNCVDASQLSNLVLYPRPGSNDWVMSGNKISGTIGLKDNKAACEDTTIWLSSYTMPDTWDQQHFPQTALPQTHIESVFVTFAKNQVIAPVTLTVNYPVPCKNVQVDLYYGPQIINLTESGHNGVYISHKFIRRDNAACLVVPTPGQGGGTVETKTDTPQVLATSTTLPATIPATGAKSNAIVIVLAAALAYAGTYFLQNRFAFTRKQQ